MSAAEAERHVLDFLAAWPRRDIEYIMTFFTDESVYHNMPVAPIQGLRSIRGIFQSFLQVFAEWDLEVIAIAAKPDLVLVERVDRFVMTDGRKVVLPVNGVFVIRDRKFLRFSDYFDLGSFERQTSIKL
jgi:limonene-1,2-epoxide hydrolase